MINAFGYAVQRLMADHSIVDIVQMIEDLASNAGASEMEDFFLISRWGGVCVNAEKDRPTIIASVPAQKLAAERLVSVIRNGALEEQNAAA
ncbi:bacteriophage protein [Enterobacter cloacae]|nr:bacteriophage protein [Enterobacter cloacae]